MRTYRALFAVPEFSALFSSMSLRYAGGTMESIALATLVYARTDSPLLSALSMFGASAMQAVGAATSLSLADRLRPRAAMTVIGLGYAAVTLALAAPLPIWTLLLITLVPGLAGAVSSGVQWGLVREVVPAEAYVLARSTFTMALGVMQIAGFGLGGVLVSALSSRTTLVIAAGLQLAATLLTRCGLRDRPARLSEPASMRAGWRDNVRLWGMPARRYLYLAMWVPNGLIVGCEALFVPFSPHWSGLLLAASGLGMLSGDVLVARLLPPDTRGRLVSPLRLLLAVPYLGFALIVPIGAAVALVVVASVGYGAGLLLQERLIAITPEELTGHALGLHSSGMLTMQAIGAALAGAIAERFSPGVSMAILAVASVLVTVALTPGLTRPGARRLPGPAVGYSGRET